MTTKVNFQPTLFIFMGTSSGQIGWRLKKLLYEAYGEVPIFRFLWIDIDATMDTLAQPWFSKAERVELSGMVPADVIANIKHYKEIEAWWPGTKVPAGRLAGGGGAPQQMRLVGRLALFRMFNDTDRDESFYTKLKAATQALREIQNIEATIAKSNEKMEYSVADGCRVVLVFSPCGGTGSALSFDVAYLCRKFLANENPDIISIGVLPSVIDKAIKDGTRLQQQKVRANAYAWFREDDVLTDQAHWNVMYPGNQPVEVYAPPFSYKFVVDIVNQAGYRLNSADDVYNMISQALFTQTILSTAGFTQNLSILGDEFEGKLRSFSSLASAALVFPRQRLLAYCAHQFGSVLLKQGVLGQPEEHQVAVAAAALLARLRLKDNDLLADLLANRKVKMIMEASIMKADTVAAAIAQMDAQEAQNQTARTSEAEMIDQVSRSHFVSIKKAFDQEITNLAANEGFQFALAVLEKLLQPAPGGTIEEADRLDSCKARISQQGARDSDVELARKDYARAHTELKQMDDGVEDKVQRFFDKSGWKNSFALKKRDGLTAMGKINQLTLQLAAQKHAVGIYDQLATFALGLKTILEAAISKTTTVSETLASTDLGSTKEAEKNRFEFMREIDIDFPAYYQAHAAKLSPSVFRNLIPATVQTNMATLAAWVEKSLQSATIQYAGFHFVTDLENQSLLEALVILAQKNGKTPEAYIEAELNSLVAYCQPFCTFQKNRGLENFEDVSLIGVEDENNPLLPASFRNHRKYVVKTTGFRDRVYVVQYRHGIPAFLVSEMEEYRLVYEDLRKKRDPLHILPGMDEADDLLPEQGHHNREMFAIGLQFDLIVKVGAWYYYDPERTYKTHQVRPGREFRLEQGRDKAEDVFSHRDEWVTAVEEKVDNEIEEMGNKEASLKIQRAIDAHLAAIAKMPPDEKMRKQYEKEIEAFKALQRRLM